jgi:formate-dependent nitrite reductase membrane component NrfD
MTFSSLIAVYLFLGGTAAGTFVVAAGIDLLFPVLDTRLATMPGYRSVTKFGGRASRRRLEATCRRVDQTSYATALIALATGILCLIADLGRPHAFYYLFMFPTASFVSIGAFALTFLTLCLVIVLVDALLTLGGRGRRAARIARAVGIPFAVVVMVYTGLLLKSVMAVGLWQSGWLPVLFLFSALSCGCAVVMFSVCACEDAQVTRRWQRAIVLVDFVCVVCETLSAAAFLVSVSGGTGTAAVRQVMQGDQAVLFWAGFVACGIALPATMEVLSRVTGRTLEGGSGAAVAACVLIGGLCLRLVVVASGVQTAV